MAPSKLFLILSINGQQLLQYGPTKETWKCNLFCNWLAKNVNIYNSLQHILLQNFIVTNSIYYSKKSKKIKLTKCPMFPQVFSLNYKITWELNKLYQKVPINWWSFKVLAFAHKFYEVEIWLLMSSHWRLRKTAKLFITRELQTARRLLWYVRCGEYFWGFFMCSSNSGLKW